MNRLNIILVILTTFIVVFCQSSVEFIRNWLGAQPDLLPGLVIYAALTSGLGLATSVAMLGGLWTDSLSRNPLGISILPLFLTGVIIEGYRGLILRDQTYAQLVIGAWVSAAVPALTLLLILNTSMTPMVGWSSLWQWIVVTLIGGLMTPVWFWVFGWLLRGLSYEALPDPMSQANRQLKRGRS